MQYCTRPLMMNGPTEPGQEYCIFFCRVLLGSSKCTDEVLAPPSAGNLAGFVRRPPARDGAGRWDSIIANPGDKTRAGDGGAVVHTQAHREFVVFSRDQVYPEYL